MKADITRDTFDPGRNFLRVLMQQGRVFLDADWNEQASILIHYMQRLAADVIGPHGGTDADSFLVTLTDGMDSYEDLKIGKGRYYVQGLICENLPPDGAGEVTLADQPYSSSRNSRNLPDPPYVVYLDVWERAVTFIEDEEIAEVALNGPDTAARTRLVWQVKVLHLEATGAADDPVQAFLDDTASYDKFLRALAASGVRERGGATLAAKAKDRPGTGVEDACILSPDARYRGLENQLYRVEIHGPGPAQDASKRDGAAPDGPATFKWSRENGSVAFAIEGIADRVVTLAHAPRDRRYGLKAGDWVEVVDDDYALSDTPEPLLRVESFDPIERAVTLSDSPAPGRGRDPLGHPLLRRWDQRVTPAKADPASQQGVIAVSAAKDREVWLELEDGVQVRFEAGGEYRAGDYWLIPARVDARDTSPNGDGEPGNILWPEGQSLAPHGVRHAYAPLAVVPAPGGAGPVTVTSCRYLIKRAAELIAP
jgi:hypothetical protein